VSSALEVAKAVKSLVAERDMQRVCSTASEYRYYTSDSVEKFARLCSIIMNHTVTSAEKIDIEKY
jgi:glutamate racemase